jgi:ferredoxin
MDAMILEKDKIGDIIETLSKDHNVFAPIVQGGVVMFSEVGVGDTIELERFSRTSAKSMFFPQTEVMLRFKMGKEGKVEGPEREDRGTAIVGLRACDGRSFEIMDKVFGGDIDDPYWSQKRENSILIGMTCNKPGPNCFCPSVGGGPFYTTGMDVMLSDLGDKFYAEIVTEKGRKFIEDNKALFTPAEDGDKQKKEELASKAEDGFKRQVDISDLGQKLENIFEDDYWAEAAAKCFGCGICTFLCPTCHCFDIQDETLCNDVKRVRVWDSCMYPEYTMHASGHNPRPGRMNRIRNRVYHKYKFMIDNLEVIGCVGCGRCIDYCPTNTDIIELLDGAKGVEK